MNEPTNQPESNEEFPTAQRVDMICDQFESAWRNGDSPAIEQFLGETTGSERNQLIHELLALELEFRIDSGESPRLEEYTPRFDEAEIATLFLPSEEETVTKSLFIKGEDSIDATVISPQAAGGFYSKLVQDDQTGQQDDSSLRNWVKDQDNLQQFGEYVIISEIARGGMGVVYKAYQKNLNRLVALKMITQGEFANKEEVLRFQIEAESAAQLDHPGIVPVYDVGEHEGRHFFSMGLVDGGSLQAAVVSQSMTHKEVAQIVLKISEAIAYAHSKGVIHRDLKPGNILLDKNNEPRVTDFGLAKKIEEGSNLTVTGQILGTPNYMPPEQAAGLAKEIRETADLYSVGAILYALLCGRPPFQSPSPMTTLKQVLEQDPVPPRQFNPKIPVDLETICLKCLEKKREQRYQSAQELAEELNRFIAGHPISARPISSFSRFKRWCQRNPVVAGLSMAFVLSMFIGSGVSVYFGLLAQSRADAAQTSATTVMKTLDKVIYSVDKELKQIPAAREIRKVLLKEALADLEQIPTEFLRQSKVDLDSAIVLRNLGLIIAQIGDDDSSSGSAVSYFQRSVEILEQLLIQEPESETILNELALSAEQLGETYMEMRNARLAEIPLKRNLELMERLVASYPDNDSYQFGLSYAWCIWSEHFAMVRRFPQAIKAGQTAVEVSGQLLEKHPDQPKYKDRHAANLEKLGDAFFDMGNLQQAKIAYESTYKIFENLYQENPDNLRNQFSFSVSCERMGNLYSKLGNHELARKYYAQEVEVAEMTAIADPKNIGYQDDLRIAYDKLVTELYALEKQEEAQAIRMKSRNIQEFLNTEIEKRQAELPPVQPDEPVKSSRSPLEK